MPLPEHLEEWLSLSHACLHQTQFFPSNSMFIPAHFDRYLMHFFLM